MRGVYQGVPQGTQGLQDCREKWQEGCRSSGQEFLHRLYHMRGCMQARGDTPCAELVTNFNNNHKIKIARSPIYG